MKKLLTVLVLAVSFLKAVAVDSPVGSWEVFTKGRDQGLYRFTFTGDFNFSAYGINREGAELSVFSGTWSISEDNKFVMVNLPPEEEGDSATTLRLTVKAGKKIAGTVIASDATFPLAGKPAPASVYSLTGDWDVTIKEGSELIPSTFTFVPTVDFPGVFDFTDGVETAGKFIVAQNGQFYAFGGDLELQDCSPAVGKINVRNGTFNGNIFDEEGVFKLKGVRATD